MKVLYVWEIARFSEVLSAYINNNYGQARIVCVRKAPIKFCLLLIKELLFFRPDIVHIHYWTKGVIFSKLFSPRAKIIMHFHGGDVRGKDVPGYVKRYADKILVSTRDLKQYCDGDWYGYPTG